jgi:serine/threonine protein kinase/Flp pilus assembly protein TadD
MGLAAGARLSRYRIEELIGRGGMGEVYRARDEALDRPVAIKVVRGDLTADDDRLRRFAQEARAASALNHPHIIHVYEVGEHEGLHFIAMEFVDGVTLREAIAGRASLSQLVRYLEQVADALDKAHAAGIVHRDLKPDNILVARDRYAKVADFGLAKLRRTPGRDESIESLTAEGAVMGTPAYMAPEQVLGERADHRSDIFAFGCILYEAVTGRRAFDAPSHFSLMKRIAYEEPASFPDAAPSTLQRIVERCLAKDPGSRWQSMGEIATELHAALRQIEAEEEAPTILRSGAVPKRRRRLLIAIPAAMIVVLLVIWATAGAWKRKDDASPVSVASTVKQARVPIDSPAYDAYMRGRVNVSNEEPAKNDRAIEQLKSAVASDPDFAPAHALLARAYSIKAFYYAGKEERQRVTEDAEVALKKALALDPNLAEAHLARGVLLWTAANRFPHEEAIAAFRRALELDPSLDEAHHQLGLIYVHIGLLDKASSEIREALRINPANALARFRSGVIALNAGRCEDALAIFNSTSRRNPGLLAYQTGDALFCLGRDEEAIAVIDQYLKENPRDEGGVATSVRAMILARSGRDQEAREAISTALRIGEGFGHFHHTAFNVACAWAIMNRPDEAVRWLESAANDGFPHYPRFLSDRNLENIRRDPRYQALMTRLKKDYERRLRSL